MSRVQRSPPPPSVAHPSNNKRNLEQISPELPNSKKVAAKENMENTKVSDLTLEQLMTVLATKDDFREMNNEVKMLKEENSNLAGKVDDLAKKCQQMESEMHSLYIWKNSSNLIVKVGQNGSDIETARQRVADICSELSNVRGIVETAAIKELKARDREKYVFKVYLKQPTDAVAILRNTSKMRGTDISISKDLPLAVRQQKAKLLQLRRFLLTKTTCKPKLQGHLLIVGADKLSWSLDEGRATVNNGESFESFLLKYGLQQSEFDDFLRQKQRNTNNVISENGGHSSLSE